MRYVVTGGAGFLGSHLVDRLLGDGHRVCAVDNLVTGSSKNIEHLARESRFEFRSADVSRSMPELGPVDGVLHLASPASPIDFVPLAIPILEVGALGTRHALEYAKKAGAWFLMASTSEVYGDPEVHPQTEAYLGNVNPIGIRGVYDEGKRFAEALTMAYHRTHGLPVSIVRIFNTYGPRMRADDGRVIPNFISQALKGQPLTLNGGGGQTRSFCFVRDLVEGLARFASVKPVGPINLGNPSEMSMRSLAQVILRLTGSSSSLVETPLPEGDPRQRCPVIERARKILGWSPSTTLEDGLKETVDYFRRIL
jgi:dTDP-glucose 4,6-dehydratase